MKIFIALFILGLSLPVYSETNSSFFIKRPIDVYKSPTCGCCGAWVEHLQQAGFRTRVEHPANLDKLKQQLGIAPQWQSCHTAVNSGYFFEGHIPAAVMQRFLQERPQDVAGLAVPGMPMGSPGMDVDGQFQPYDVIKIHKDGSHSVYARVAKDNTQFMAAPL